MFLCLFSCFGPRSLASYILSSTTCCSSISIHRIHSQTLYILSQLKVLSIKLLSSLDCSDKGKMFSMPLRECMSTLAYICGETGSNPVGCSHRTERITQAFQHPGVGVLVFQPIYERLRWIRLQSLSTNNRQSSIKRFECEVPWQAFHNLANFFLIRIQCLCGDTFRNTFLG